MDMVAARFSVMVTNIVNTTPTLIFDPNPYNHMVKIVLN